MKTINDIDVKNKNVLVRVDYNVPMKDGKITDDLRIRASLPTINKLIEKGANKIILISHLGRPEGKFTPGLSLSPVWKQLIKLLPDQKIGHYDLPKPGEKVTEYSDVNIILLENLRFDPREEANDKDFIKNIIDSCDADIYVQDGFAVVHRAHASTDAVKEFLPVYAGLLVEKEIINLEKIIKNPTHPVLLIIGGAKVDDKYPLIDKFSKIADHIVVGGKIAADGYETNNPKIYVAEDFDENAEGKKLDIGPVSTAKIADFINESKTVIWNGLLGYAEDPAFATSSTIVAKLIGEKPELDSIICGGDTAGFVENLMKDNKNLNYALVSTGGGAAIEFLIGKELPGIKAIKRS